MKTLNSKTKMTKLMFGALTALVLMTTACSKSSSNPAPPPPPPIAPVGCVSMPCAPGGQTGGQLLYSGAGQSSGVANANFQVYGNPSGDGAGSASGSLQVGNWLCANGSNLAGTYQFNVQGNMIGGQIMGNGQMNQFAVQVQIDPGVQGTPNSGFFSIKIDGCPQYSAPYTEFSFNF